MFACKRAFLVGPLPRNSLQELKFEALPVWRDQTLCLTLVIPTTVIRKCFFSAFVHFTFLHIQIHTRIDTYCSVWADKRRKLQQQPQMDVTKFRNGTFEGYNTALKPGYVLSSLSHYSMIILAIQMVLSLSWPLSMACQFFVYSLAHSIVLSLSFSTFSHICDAPELNGALYTIHYVRSTSNQFSCFPTHIHKKAIRIHHITIAGKFFTLSPCLR